MIDWQIGSIRTMPNEHVLPNKNELNDQLEKIKELHPRVLQVLKESQPEEYLKDAAIMLGAQYIEKQDDMSDDEIRQEVQPEPKFPKQV